jgi:hypothetical protein
MGDFEKAMLSCDRALKIAPYHTPASALRTELSFILGAGHPIPGNTATGACFSNAPISQPQLLVEIDKALAEGDRFAIFGDQERAERSFRKVLEFVKWIATSDEMSQRCEQARIGLRYSRPPVAEK